MNTTTALLAATVLTTLFILTWIVPKARHFLYYDEVEVDVEYYAYYNHELKAVSYQGIVEEVSNVNNIFKAIDHIANKNKLVATDGFITEIGYKHYVLVERREDRHYDVIIYENTSLLISELQEQKWLMRKTTDEQDMFEILCEAYEELDHQLYWEYRKERDGLE